MDHAAAGPAAGGGGRFDALCHRELRAQLSRLCRRKFQVDHVANRGTDKIVQTRLVSTKDTTNITYRMRELDGGWKIIDVYYDGISQLTLQRTDFGAAMAKGGVAALVSHLNGLSDGLMK